MVCTFFLFDDKFQNFEQRDTVHGLTLVMVRSVPGSIQGKAQKLFLSLLAPLLHLTCGAGAVDEVQFAVCSTG